MQVGHRLKLECGPMPNVMAALLNIARALCSTLQLGWRLPLKCHADCSNEAKTRNLLKFAWVPQTTEPILAASGP